MGYCSLCTGYALYSIALGSGWSDPHTICCMSRMWACRCQFCRKVMGAYCFVGGFGQVWDSVGALIGHSSILLHLVGFLSSRFTHDARSQEHKAYKKQLVYALSGTSRCLFWDKYKTHKYSVGRAYSCYLKTQSVPRCKHFSSRL